MIGQYIQRLQQGVAPERPMTNGGGGGSSQTYYANQDKLFGAQADIATNLYNQYASMAPTYLANTQGMVDDAMDGTLSKQMQEQAGNNATATMGAALDANNRNMQRYGMGFSADRLLTESNRNAIMGAAGKASAMNQASAAAEDQKWNRNANAYGQIAGMGSGAMQGMGSAASGYGGMASSVNQNNAANAQGWGKFGASMVSGSKWADGGYIEKKPGLHLANGGPAFQNYLQPVSWRNQATNGNLGSGGTNPLLMLGGMAAAKLAFDEFGPDVKSAMRAGLRGAKDSVTGLYNSATAPAAGEFTVDQTLDPSYVQPFDYAAQDAMYAGQPDGAVLYEADGGYIRRGLRLAGGGYASQIGAPSENENSRQGYYEAPNPYVRMGEAAAVNQGAKYGYGAAKDAWNGTQAPAPVQTATPTSVGSDVSMVSSSPSTAGVTTAPVADAQAGVTSSALPEATASGVEAATGAEAAGTTAATEAAGTAAATTGAEAAGTDAATTGAEAALGSAAADAALATAGETAAAAVGAEAAVGTAAAANAWNPAGWVLAAGLAANELGLFDAKGGEASRGKMVPLPPEKRGLQPKRKNFKPGGKVQGPGTETSDDIPAWLSDGEFVLNAEAVKLIGKDKLEKWNSQGLKLRGQKEEVAEGHPGVKDSPAEEKREARGLKAKPVKKAKGGMIKRKGC